MPLISTALPLALRTLLCAGLCATSVAQAQIYGGVDTDGSIVLSNFRTERAREVVVDDRASDASFKAGPAGSPDFRYSGLIHEAARASDISPGLLHAVIAVESGFDQRAVSPKGAKGLMQLMPATAASLGVTDPFDPGQNIAAGAAYLKSLLLRFDNNLELALAAYNAGAEAVIKAGYQIPRYPETRAYVPRVIARMRLAETGAATR